MTRDVTVWSPVDRGCWSWVLLAGLTLSRQEAQSLLSWPHRHWNKCFSGHSTSISNFTFLLEVAVPPTSPNPPCWPFSTESRIIKIQFNYYMQIKTTGMKNWLFHKLWKLLCSADLYSLHFLCPGPILHDLIVQWSDSHECYWYEWSPCIWVKWFLLGRLTTCPDLWWTVCMVDKSVNWR